MALSRKLHGLVSSPPRLIFMMGLSFENITRIFSKSITACIARSMLWNNDTTNTQQAPTPSDPAHAQQHRCYATSSVQRRESESISNYRTVVHKATHVAACVSGAGPTNGSATYRLIEFLRCTRNLQPSASFMIRTRYGRFADNSCARSRLELKQFESLDGSLSGRMSLSSEAHFGFSSVGPCLWGREFHRGTRVSGESPRQELPVKVLFASYIFKILSPKHIIALLRNKMTFSYSFRHQHEKYQGLQEPATAFDQRRGPRLDPGPAEHPAPK